MASNRKYANLPDLDSAPEIYETPELTDDNSTVPTTAGRPETDDEFYEVDDDGQGISRSRLRVGDARSRFLPTHVNANDVDFSERVDGKRKSYKVSSRRRKLLEDGTEELGDLSDDDDDDESLERRIARLKREVEEVKMEQSKKLAESAATQGGEGQGGRTEQLESLGQILSDISRIKTTPTPATQPRTQTQQPGTAAAAPSSEAHDSTYTVTYAPAYEQSHALAKAADFDRRLLMLEKGLGISSSSVPEMDGTGLPRAILPTLDSLGKQISTLSQASTASLDAISRRVRTLASEQDKLNDSREKAKALREELSKHAPTGGAVAAAAGGDDTADQDAKINALYGILPTIENLTPLLPPLLDRLRSLRAIHAGAATASETLDRIEQEQSNMATELNQWKGGLEKMEDALKSGDATMQGNMKTMDAWVKDIEERMGKLASS